MSVLETPRIYIKGEVSWDPIVTNNYDTNYDENTGETKFPNVADRVKAFREQAIEQTQKGGNWNPHGTHRATFFNTSVCGFDLGAGVKTDDPFVTAGVDFTGMLVDLEPFGGFTSQLFFNAMRFGVEGGYSILARRTARMTARHINFARNSANKMIAGIASVVWQTSFAKADGLHIESFNSDALKTLAQAIESDDVLGLTIRINAYRTIYYNNPNLTNGSPDTRAAAQTLYAKLKGGGFQPNPARSLLVGVLGLWRKGEPAGEPGDRALVPVGQSPLGGAQVRLGKTEVTVDLSNSVPEIDKNLTKQDLGSLTLVEIDAASQEPTTLGSFGYDAYDRAAYESSAGLVTLPLATALQQTTTEKYLELRTAAGSPLLTEQVLRAIPVTPNVYLDEQQDLMAKFQVYSRGKIAETSVPVTLFKLDASGGQPDAGTKLTTDSHGVLTVPLTANAGSIYAYVPSLSESDQPTNGINPQLNTYMYVRVHPADEAIAQLPPTWDNVYAKVLANWNAMAPCMDNWLKLDDPHQVRTFTAILKLLTDPANFEDYRFMPVTRDMSPGQRALLYKFLDLTEVELDRTAAQAREPRMNFADLSRAMRRG